MIRNSLRFLVTNVTIYNAFRSFQYLSESVRNKYSSRILLIGFPGRFSVTHS